MSAYFLYIALNDNDSVSKMIKESSLKVTKYITIIVYKESLRSVLSENGTGIVVVPPQFVIITPYFIKKFPSTEYVRALRMMISYINTLTI